jgi:hypothetical protein
MYVVAQSVHWASARRHTDDVLAGIETSAEESQLLLGLDVAVWTVFGKVADLRARGCSHYCKCKRAK